MTRVEIIGGGPAGLRVAKLLSQKGFDVTLYEASRVGDSIRCGEAYLDVYPVEKPKHGLLFEHKEVHHIANGEEVVMDGSHMYQYDKGEMLRGMQDEAVDAGARVVENEIVHSIEEEILTVDASGFPSLVYSQGNYETAFAISHIVDREVNYMLFDWEDDGSYYWEFPKEGESNVGYGSFTRFENVWEESKRHAESVGNIKDSGGGYIPIDLHKNLWISEKRTVLVGMRRGWRMSFTVAEYIQLYFLLRLRLNVSLKESLRTTRLDSIGLWELKRNPPR